MACTLRQKVPRRWATAPFSMPSTVLMSEKSPSTERSVSSELSTVPASEKPATTEAPPCSGLSTAGFGEGLCGPRILGLGFGFAGMIVGTGGPLEAGGWPASAAVSGNGGVVGTLDGASDGVVRANDDSGPSAGVEVARSNDDPGPSGRGIFFGRAGSALKARPGGRSGLPKGRMAESENAGMVAAYPNLKPSMLRSSDVYCSARVQCSGTSANPGGASAPPDLSFGKSVCLYMLGIYACTRLPPFTA